MYHFKVLNDQDCETGYLTRIIDHHVYNVLPEYEMIRFRESLGIGMIAVT